MVGNATLRKLDLRSDVVEHVVQVAADEREASDDDDRDQSRDQTILDCSGTALAADELEQLRHVVSPFSRCGP